ncbi:M20/M25/M40 family metallo-hydrolase [Candidatus Gracilibacteria bacterium]|nr:M20/M25/M40 family metallo-hydrolase [Candidatus Gracilibacteria bacterium]
MSSSIRDEIVALTCDLIRFQGVADRHDELAANADHIAAYLATIPDIFIERSEADGKPALVATLHETRSPRLMLNGHFDVVAARPEQFVPAVRDGRIYGRASQDMKGSVAVMLRLLKDLAALPERPDVGFQFVGDEEIGGALGTQRLRDEGWGCAFFIALEPTDLNICYAHKGAMWVELRLLGAAAHGSKPWQGRNPVFALNQGLNVIEDRLPELHEEIYRTTVTPTVVQTAPNSRNQVPPYLDVTFDIRWTEETPPEMLSALMREAFPSAEFKVSRSGTGLQTDPQHPYVQQLAQIITRHNGHTPQFYREHFGTDARFYSHIGVPAICLGPVGAGLHSDEEWVDIDSLARLYAILNELALSA